MASKSTSASPQVTIQIHRTRGAVDQIAPITQTFPQSQQSRQDRYRRFSYTNSPANIRRRTIRYTPPIYPLLNEPIIDTKGDFTQGFYVESVRMIVFIRR